MRRQSLLVVFGLMLSVSGLFGVPPSDLSSGQVPAWAADAVWYQIFPERFRNGDPSNDPTRDSLELPIAVGEDWKISSWTADWYARDSWETHLGPNFYEHGVFNRRYGGDLQGVLDKLDYLKDLGINALYFNPLFYARSLHKYDGSSYHHIDPFFGPDPKGDLAEIEKENSDPATWKWTAADKLFLTVIKEAHARGMKVIIDGVFNHTGRDFFAFRNLLREQEKSPYKDWYAVISFDDPNTPNDEFDYKGWFGIKSLPIFASTKDGRDIAPQPKKYIFDATRRWMDPDGNGNTAAGIDGWRLDAVEQRPLEFWSEWNALVRKINPAAYSSAEIWTDPKDWILKGGFSAVMNYYGFAYPVTNWLVVDHLRPSVFAQEVSSRYGALPRANAYAMQNLLGSHDTARLASMIVNGETIRQHDDTDQGDYHRNDELRTSSSYLITRPTERDRAIQRMTVLMQMTFVGAPMIYYGDEAGMWGAHDPDDRQPMVWEDMQYDSQTHDPRVGSEPSQSVGFNKGLFAFYRSAIRFHHDHRALSEGDFTLLVADDKADCLAFKRQSPTDDLVVVFNRSNAPQTLSVNLDAVHDHDLIARPMVIFSTDASESNVQAKTDGTVLTVVVPPLTAVVIATTP